MPSGTSHIIELYGPPGAGKTTLAKRLAENVRCGGPAELVLSLRPSEAMERRGNESLPATPLTLMRRLTRPAKEFLACIGQASPGRRPSSLASELLAILPPVSAAWSIRLRQYIVRLESSWRLAERANATVIFDQGFVQAVCSLALLTRSPTLTALEHALELIPTADQWIRVDAPRHVLRARLEARRQSQGWIERRFELDTKTNLHSIEIFDMLESILRQLYPDIALIESANLRSSPESCVAAGSCQVHSP